MILRLQPMVRLQSLTSSNFTIAATGKIAMILPLQPLVRLQSLTGNNFTIAATGKIVISYQ